MYYIEIELKKHISNTKYVRNKNDIEIELKQYIDKNDI